MHRQLLTALFCGTIALAPSAPAADPAGKPQAGALSNTIRSHRTLHILWEHDAPAPEVTRVIARLQTPEVAGKLAQQVLGVPPEVGAAMVEWDRQLAVGSGECKTVFHVDLGAPQPGARHAAREFADALVEQLSGELAESRSRHAQARLQRATRVAEQAVAALRDAENAVQDRQAKLRDGSGRADVSPEAFTAALGKLEDERQRLELELAGMQARMEAVEEELKKAMARADDKAQADPVLPELERSVALREEMLTRLRKLYESGSAPSTQVAAAEAALVDARVQLLERRSAGAAKGSEALSPLNRELQNLAIDVRDRQARLDYVKKRLDPLRKGAETIATLAQSIDRRDVLRSECREAQARVRQLQRQADEPPVDRVIVTSASDEGAK